MLKSVFVSLLFVTSYYSNAQDSTANLKLLRPNQLFLGRSGFIQNNQIFSMCELSDRLINNPEAYKEFTKHKSINKVSTVPLYFWFAGVVGGLATLNSKDNLSGKLFAASFIPLFINIHFSQKASKHYDKALSIYNSQY